MRYPTNLCDRTLAAVLLVAGIVGCSSDAPAPESRDDTAGATPLLRNLEPGVAYTGMDSCRSCHLGVHGTYARSGMPRSFRPLGERGAAGGASAWIVGSGRHLEASLAQGDGATTRLPECRPAGSSEWEPCPEGEPGQEHVASGAEARSCRGCHDVADPAAVEAPRGVDCERCHGPGELHVRRWKQTGEAGTGAPDPTIVNPRRLAGAARIAVCLQCHLGDPRSTARIPRLGRAAGEFRPGMSLDAVWSTWRVATPSAGDFGAAAQGDRLMLSRCYRESAGRLDCTTCHNPHVSVYHEDRPADLFRLQCLGCHAAEDCRGPVDERARTSPADDCAACHMRRAEPHDQRGTLYTDHWIRRLPGAATGEAAACEIEPVLHDAEKDASEGERAYYRASAWLALTRGSDDHLCSEALDRALDELTRAVEQGLDLPEARALLDRRRGEGV